MKKHKTPIFSIYYNPFDTGLIKTPSKRTKSIMTKLYYLIIFLGVCMLLLCTPATSNAQKKDSTAKDSVITNTTVLLSRSDASNALEGGMKYLEDKLTKQQWELVNNVFIQAFQQILAQREKEWIEKHKKKP